MIWFLLIWSLTSFGLIALASGMSKHQKQIFAQELDVHKTYLAISIGWISLLVGLIASILQSNISIGISYWIGALTLSALFVCLCLTYIANKIKQVAIVCMIIFITTLTLQLI